MSYNTESKDSAKENVNENINDAISLINTLQINVPDDERGEFQLQIEKIIKKLNLVLKQEIITKNLKYKIHSKDKGQKIYLTFFNSFDKLLKPQFSKVYLQVTYHYHWTLSMMSMMSMTSLFDPIVNIFPMTFCEDENVWFCDISEWVRKNKLFGYQVKIQPFCVGCHGDDGNRNIYLAATTRLLN